MRTTPIIKIIRRYGLTSKRLNPKNRIKYEDALAMIKQYENSELKIKDVIDNKRQASHNHCHCGIPGCGQRIRYEYILVPKDGSDGEIVAGSTCVWPTLGLSELKQKEFFKLDTAIRDHYALLDWKDSNPDVVDKLNRLKAHDVTYFRAFWLEIEMSPLLEEDTEFIRSVDVDKEIEKAEYNRHMKNVSYAEYNKVTSYIPELLDYYKDDNFVKDLCSRARRYSRLTGNQFRWLKVSINRMWFDRHIKGTDRDLTSDCADILKPIFDTLEFKGACDFDSIAKIEEMVNHNPDKVFKYAWMAYKCQKAIVK